MEDLVRAVMGEPERKKGIPEVKEKEHPKHHSVHHLDEILSDHDLVEAFAAIAHEAWMHWSMTIVKQESISAERKKRWERLWCPYAELSEEDKEHDRKWAREYLEAMKRSK